MAQFNSAEKIDSSNEPVIVSTDVMTGDRDRSRYLYYQLKMSMSKAKGIDIIVSFLMESGIRLILNDIRNALDRGAFVRILTGNYLGITQPSALYLIKKEFGNRIDLRFYNDKERSFHPKAYIFHYETASEIYIGSSNISKSALTSGIEWNYRFSSIADSKNYQLFYNTFENLFFHHSVVIDNEELRRYSKNWHKPAISKDLAKYDNLEEDIGEKVRAFFQPRGAQIEALCALEDSRAEGAKKGLVQAATGVGKTYLAAFDSAKFNRVLFVAHREEILKQAAVSFKNVRNSEDYGFFFGKQKDTNKSVIFASVATLGRAEYLKKEYFSEDYFDYIVIDEFQEFYNIRPDVFSDMQNLWDEYRQETKINLVISGSVYSLMQKIFTDHGEPLFGRADNILCLRSFNTKVLKQIMEDFAPGYSNDDLLALYTLTGGIPKYVELFCDNQALSVDRIYDFVFSENSLFIDEGRNLLITEFGKNYGIYFSILLEIANGHYTQGEIESVLGGISIGGHLSKLENVYNLITRERPIFAKPGTKKNVRYIIGDNFLNFWFKYIERNRSYIELQNFEDLRQLAKADYQTYSGRVLENYFKQKLAEEGGFKEIGSWWETKSSTNKERLNSYEIDIVALKSSGKKALIAEVKRMPENNYVHSTFMEKVEHLRHKEMAKYDIETRVLGLEDM